MTPRRLLLTGLLACALPVAASSLRAELDVRYAEPGAEGPVLVLGAGGEPLLASPQEGLWSIATAWEDDWPGGWHHARPERRREEGPWTILEGRLQIPAGEWILRDACRREGDRLRVVRRWEWRGREPLREVTLSVRFRVPARTRRVVLPGILYHGNPSGEASGRVPVFHGSPGEEAIFEEHRYPMPFASCEWGDAGSMRGAALHSLPSPVPRGSVRDQWWSLGVTAQDDSSELVLLSGPCASNGRRSVIKAVQPGFVGYPPAWLEVMPGAVIEKTFFLEVYPVPREGSGFARPIRTSLDLHPVEDMAGLPGFAEIIEAKYRYARTRWYEQGDVAGFEKYADRDFLVMGWCGQAASPGYALQVLAPQLGDPSWKAKVEKSLDFLSGAAFHAEGFHTWYDIGKKEWRGIEPLSEGQAMANFAWAIRAARRTGLDSRRWESFLRKACDVHAARILADGWRPRSTDQAFFIAPLCEAFKLFGEQRYRDAALKAGRVYRDRHLSMREPYWGGTLDARCEDKEGAYAAFQGFLALHDLGAEGREFLEAAEHALNVVLTYVVVWDIDLPPGRLRDHAFRTRGWTVVSPQNQHIDAYGVLMTPDIYRFGRITGRKELQDLATVMYRSCGQLIDPFGSHGEQPQHTNYAQRGRVDDPLSLRGGYVEDWTVFWLTAHFLNAAARLKELGVDVGG
ncbi:MAG: hypothetical protein JXA90_03270 [Planctomycetes bacterium]|nr:hypothetical protein [Planctomycetota bacterium]